MTWRLVTMRSAAMKNPLPRESVLPFVSKVSMATADGLIRRTSSGRYSCPAAASENTPTSTDTAKMLRHVFLIERAGTLQIIGILAGLNKQLRRKASSRRCHPFSDSRLAYKNSTRDFTDGYDRIKIFILI